MVFSFQYVGAFAEPSRIRVSQSGRRGSSHRQNAYQAPIRTAVMTGTARSPYAIRSARNGSRTGTTASTQPMNEPHSAGTMVRRIEVSMGDLLESESFLGDGAGDA